MKVSKGQSQPEIAAEFRLLIPVHGSGDSILVPGLDCDSMGVRLSLEPHSLCSLNLNCLGLDHFHGRQMVLLLFLADPLLRK